LDITGKVIKNLIDSKQGQGNYKIKWNGKTSNGDDAENGAYYYRLETRGNEQTQQVIKLK